MVNITNNYKDIKLVKDDSSKLCLADFSGKSPVLACVDFLSGKNDYRRKHGGGFGQAIAKAVGISGKNKPYIIDATAGFGADAFVLASLGCKVLMLEKSLQVFAVLEDGLQRLQNITNKSEELLEISKRLSVKNTDALNFLESTKDSEKPDVIYLDPMFPESNKSASSRKEMVILQKLLETDNNKNDLLLQTALTKTKNRIVVKRPRQSPFLANIEPSHSIVGKANRFDVYTIK